MTNPMDNIDYKLLRKQKEWLVEQSNEYADGLVELLDTLMDDAEKRGIEGVFTSYELPIAGKLTHGSLAAIVDSIQKLLYTYTDAERGTVVSPDISWDANTLGAIATIFDGFGLTPVEVID